MRKGWWPALVALFLTLAVVSPVPTHAQNDGYCYTNTCYHYVGPWEWDTSLPWGGFWRGPEGTLGGFDLRSLPEQGTPGGPPGLGFWVVDKQLGPGYILLTTNLDSSVLPPLVKSLESTWGIKLESQTTRGLLWEMLAEEGDPTGQTRWKPLSPRPDGSVVINLGGYSPVVLEKDPGKRQPVKGSWKDTVRDFAKNK